MQFGVQITHLLAIAAKLVVCGDVGKMFNGWWD